MEYNSRKLYCTEYNSGQHAQKYNARNITRSRPGGYSMTYNFAEKYIARNIIS